MPLTILKPSESLALLETYQRRAQKRYGQNFIIDNNIVEKIARVGQAQDQVVLEIGPGLGALTQFLVRDARAVVAVEIDPICVDILHTRFQDVQHFSLVCGDFLTFTPDDLGTQTITHVIANLPYYITTPIVFQIIEHYPQVTHMTIMVQKEVAQRFSAQPNTKAYNALSVILQRQWTIELAMRVPPSVFHPRPRVASAVVRFVKKPQAQPDPSFDAWVKQGFAQRRKTLLNNLKTLPQLKSTLITLGLDPAVRAEALSVAQWERLVEVLRNAPSDSAESLLK
jgi:16S rRNA (adenine1518-N6/adenine1519-N6)-dimethyltransferase